MLTAAMLTAAMLTAPMIGLTPVAWSSDSKTSAAVDCIEKMRGMEVKYSHNGKYRYEPLVAWTGLEPSRGKIGPSSSVIAIHSKADSGFVIYDGQSPEGNQPLRRIELLPDSVFDDQESLRGAALNHVRVAGFLMNSPYFAFQWGYGTGQIMRPSGTVQGKTVRKNMTPFEPVIWDASTQKYIDLKIAPELEKPGEQSVRIVGYLPAQEVLILAVDDLVRAPFEISGRSTSQLIFRDLRYPEDPRRNRTVTLPRIPSPLGPRGPHLERVISIFDDEILLIGWRDHGLMAFRATELLNSAPGRPPEEMHPIYDQMEKDIAAKRWTENEQPDWSTLKATAGGQSFGALSRDRMGFWSGTTRSLHAALGSSGVSILNDLVRAGDYLDDWVSHIVERPKKFNGLPVATKEIQVVLTPRGGGHSSRYDPEQHKWIHPSLRTEANAWGGAHHSSTAYSGLEFQNAYFYEFDGWHVRSYDMDIDPWWSSGDAEDYWIVRGWTRDSPQRFRHGTIYRRVSTIPVAPATDLSLKQ